MKFSTRIKGAVDGWRMPMAGVGSMGAGHGYIPKHWDWNFWQEGKDPLYLEVCAAVEAGVAAYAQTVAMLPGTVWRKDADNGRTELANHPLAKVLEHPNEYQTRSDFLMNQVRALYFRGNCYAFAEQDSNGLTSALHPIHPDSCAPYVNRETNDVFWSIAPTDLTPGMKEWPLDQARLVPDEFIWHVHMATPHHPLCGVSPLTSCALGIATNINMNRQTLAFLANMSRPSGTLNTDLKLSKENVDELRLRWREHSSGASIGGTPILTHGLKWNALSLEAPDTQLIDFYKLSIADIGRALRIPLPLIGVMDQSTFNNAEVLMQFWKASGLGWLLEHIELSLDKFFNLPRDQYCELDTDALLRSEFKTRIDGLVRGVQGGVFSPNEARAMEGLPRVDAGDMPRVQQQLVPLDFEPPEPAAAAAPASAPALPPPGQADDDDELSEQISRAFAVMGGRLVDIERRQAVLLDRTERPAEMAQQLNVELRRELVALQSAMDVMRMDFSELQQSTPREGAPGRDGQDGAPGAPGENGSLLESFRGDWDINEIYQRGNITRTPDGALWIALSLTHDWPVEDADAWQMLTPAPQPGKGFQYRGVYLAGMEVQPGDVVTGQEGAAWVWMGAASRSTTCPGECWQVMVKQGASGGRGRPGEPGQRGPAGATIGGLSSDDASITMHMTDGRSFTIQWEPRA